MTKRILVLILFSVMLTPHILELKSQEVVEILSHDGRLERSLFSKQRKIGEYNKNGKLLRLSADYIYRKKIF